MLGSLQFPTWLSPSQQPCRENQEQVLGTTLGKLDESHENQERMPVWGKSKVAENFEGGTFFIIYYFLIQFELHKYVVRFSCSSL